MNPEKNVDSNPLIQAYHLYQNLKNETQKSSKEKKNSQKNEENLTTKEKIKEVFIKQKNGSLLFVKKKSLQVRFSTRRQLNYQKNLAAVADLFTQIKLQDNDSFQKAVDQLQSQGFEIDLEKLHEVIDNLREAIVLQKTHVEHSRLHKNPLKLREVEHIQIPQFTAKKTELAARVIFNKEKELRKELETALKEQFFSKTFSEPEIQVISSFLSTYTQDVLEELKKGNHEPFKLAILKALGFASENDVDHLISINSKINPQKEEFLKEDEFNLSRFAHVFGDSFIKGSGLEGENTRNIYTQLIAAYFKEKGQNLPNSAAMAETLENSVSLDSPLTPDQLLQQIKATLNASKETPKRCILLGGWMQHGLVYEVEQQKNGKLAFRVYNEGEGIQYHDQVQEEYKTKYAGCIGIKDIPEKLFFKDSFLACLQQLAHLSSEGLDGKSPIELLVGHFMPMLQGTKETAKDHIERYLSPQRAGTCTYRSVMAYLAHIMTKGVYEEFKFDFKLYMLEKFEEKLKVSANQNVTKENYDERRLELSVIRRSIEKYGASIEKIKNQLSPEQIIQVKDTILKYEGFLKILDHKILKYEKGIYTNTIAELKGKPLEIEPKILGHKFHGKFRDTALIGTSSDSYGDRDYQKLSFMIDQLPSDPKLIDYSKKLELCLYAFTNSSSLFNNIQRLMAASKLMQKLGSIRAWDTIKFDDPIKAQSVLQKISKRYSSFIQRKYIDHKAERVCIYLSFCYALEKATSQLPEHLRIIDVADSSITSAEIQHYIKRLRTSEPFWVQYITEMTQIPNQNQTEFFSMTNQENKLELTDELSNKIWNWLTTTEYAKPIYEVIQLCIKKHRETQKILIHDTEKKFLERKLQLEKEYPELQKLAEEELNNFKTIEKEKKHKITNEKELMRLKAFENVEKLSLQIKENRNKYDNLELEKQKKIQAIENDPQYWPKGFESNEKSVNYKTNFLFSIDKKFIKEAFSPENINEISKNNSKIQAQLSGICNSGSVLPNEFKKYVNNFLISQHIHYKKNMDVEVTFFHDKNQRDLPRLPFVVSIDLSLKDKLDLLENDIYLNNLSSEGQQRYRYQHENFKAVNPETAEPAFVQKFLTDIAKENPEIVLSEVSNHDKIREIFSLTVDKNSQIDSLLNYFQEHIFELSTTDGINQFHSFLFERDLLQKELKVNSELLIPHLKKFFQKTIENFIELQKYDTAANLFWMASNIQKYIEFENLERKEKQLPILEAIIDIETAYSIIDAVSNRKESQNFEKQWGDVFEALLASCTHLIKFPFEENKNNFKLLGYAWAAHIMCNRTQVKHTCNPRTEDAGRFKQTLKNFVINKDYSKELLVKLANQSVAPILSGLYPQLPDNLNFNYRREDVLESPEDTYIDFVRGNLLTREKIRVFGDEIPTDIVNMMLKNELYNKEDISNLKCSISGNTYYINDSKNNLEIIVERNHLGDSFYIKHKDRYTYLKLIPEKLDSIQNNFLKNNFHQFVDADGSVILLDSKTFQPSYFVTQNSKLIKSCNPPHLIVGAAGESTLFSSFETSNHSLFFVDADDKLQQIQFPRLNLTFKNNGKKYALQQQPGWSLAEEQFVPHLGQKTGFLVLENEKGQKKALLPVWDSTIEHKLKKDSLNYSYLYDFKSDQKQVRYVECAIHNNYVIPNSLEARYYLAQIYLETGRLDEAEKLLFAGEADPSHKALSKNECQILEGIIHAKKSGDTGSRTLRMQLRALYLYLRNERQFPKEIKCLDMQEHQKYLQRQMLYIALMQDYTERLGHINPLDKQEELLILNTLPDGSLKLKARKYELEKNVEGEAIQFIPEKESLENAYTSFEGGLISRGEVQRNPNIKEVFQKFKSDLKDKLDFRKYRSKNTFPFGSDYRTINKEAFLKYWPMATDEALKEPSWKQAQKNGLAPMLYSLLLTCPREEKCIRDEILLCLSRIGGRKLFRPTHTPAISESKSIFSKKNSSPTAHSSLPKLKELATPVDDFYLSGLDILSAPFPETHILKLQNEYLDCEQKAVSSGHTKDLFKDNSPELIDETSKEKFKYCQEDIKEAEKNIENTYILKADKDYSNLEHNFNKNLTSVCLSLAQKEQMILKLLTAAIESNSLSQLEFLAKNRKMPTFDQICILCARKNEKPLKEMFPELSSASIEKLKNGIKNYLVEKQSKQQLERALNLTDEIRKIASNNRDYRSLPEYQSLQDTLGQTLSAKRAYELEDPNAFIFLQLETFKNIKFREDQVKNLNKFFQNPREEIALQMIMGAGKTSILQPLIGFLLAEEGSLSTTIVPEALFEPVKEGLAQVLGQVFENFVTFMDYDRHLAKDVGYLKSFISTLKEAQERGSVVLFTPQQKESIITSLYEAYQDQDSRKEVIAELCEYLQFHEVDQVDEIDTVYDPRVIFKYSMGTKELINTQEAALCSDLILSLVSDPEIHQTVSLDFVRKFKERKGETLSDEAVGINPESFRDIIQPKIAAKAIDYLKQRSVYIKNLFLTSETKSKAELYFPYALAGSTPFEETLQELCLPLEAQEIYSTLAQKSAEELEKSSNSKDPKVAATAKKILFQKEMNGWIKIHFNGHPEEQGLIGACNNVISVVMPKSLFKECGSQYGNDPKPNAHIARPYHAPGSPKKTMFKTQYEQVIYSTQEILYYGIPKNEAEKMLKQFQEAAQKEMKANQIGLAETEAYQVVSDLLGKEFKNFKNFFNLSEEFIEAFQLKASLNQEMIHRYLNSYVFPEIGEYANSLSCTPQALGGSSKSQSGYTGTMHEGILTRTQTADPEKGTDGRTILAVQNKMRAGKATTEVFVPTLNKTPSAMMIDKFMDDKNLFVFIDSGGWLKEDNIHEYAAKLLLRCQKEGRKEIQGIIYHDEKGAVVSLELDENGKNLIKVPVTLSRLKSNEGQTLTIIGQKYETGTNIAQKTDAKAFMSIRKGMTLRDALQSIFRMRGVLKNQAVLFGLTTDASDSIASGILDGLFLQKGFKECFKENNIKQALIKLRTSLKELSIDDELVKTIEESFKILFSDKTRQKLGPSPAPRVLYSEFGTIFKKNITIESEKIWRYFTVNQSRAEQEKNWLAAQHKMKEVIEKPIRMALFDKKLSSAARDEIFEKFKNFLVETQNLSTFNMMITGSSYVDSKTAIKMQVDFYKNIYSALHEKPFASSSGAKQILSNIKKCYAIEDLNQIEQVLNDCTDPKSIPSIIRLGNLEEQELEQEAELEKEVEQTVEIETEIEIASILPNLNVVQYESLASELNEIMDAGELFKNVKMNSLQIQPVSNIIPKEVKDIFPDLHAIAYSKNLYTQGAEIGSSLQGNYFLPGRYLLITQDDTSTKYVLVSHQDAGKIKEGIRNSALFPPQTLTLVSYSGNISACTDFKQANEVVKNEKFKHIALTAKLLSGKTSYNRDEIKLIFEMIKTQNDPHKSAKNLHNFLNSVIKYLPSEAKNYNGSSLQRLLKEFYRIKENK